MAKREEKRRLRQAQTNRTNQMWRGIDLFAPSGVTIEYAEDVYPLVSRRGRIMDARGMSKAECEKLFGKAEGGNQ